GNLTNGTGTGGLIKVGAGTLALTPAASNTFNGNLQILAGQVNAAADTALGGVGTSNIVLAGTLSETTAYNTARNIALGVAGGGTGTIDIAAGGTSILSGNITANGGGFGALTKSNTTATLTLTPAAGSNSYQGPTTILG